MTFSINEQRAAKFGYGKSPAANKVAPPVDQPRTLYSGSLHGAALSSYFDRRRAGLTNDAGRLAEARTEERLLAVFLARKGITPGDAQIVLAKLHEYDTSPRSAATSQARAMAAYETLRQSHGGIPQADATIARYNAMANELRAEIPSLADRAALSGANLDVAVINTLARYATAAT